MTYTVTFVFIPHKRHGGRMVSCLWRSSHGSWVRVSSGASITAQIPFYVSNAANRNGVIIVRRFATSRTYRDHTPGLVHDRPSA